MLNLKRVILAAFFLSGSAALVYEIVWTQLLTLAFGASAYSFSLMLAAFFAGLALGGYTGGKYIGEKKDAAGIFAYLELGIGLSGLFILLFFDKIETPVYLFYNMSGSFYLFMASLFILSFLFMLVPATLMGATLPVISRIYAQNKDNVGRDIGTVFSFNTFGAIFGSFAAGFILIPWVGLAKTALIAALINISAALMVFHFSKGENSKRFYAIFSAALVMVLFVSSFTVQPMVAGVYKITRDPTGEFKKYYGKEEVVYYGSNAYGTVAVEDEGGWRSLWINNKADASTTPDDMNTQLLLGYLPMFANPGAKKVLNIGLGGGFTLGAIEAFDISGVDVIELNPLVVEASRRYFSEFNGNALGDKRINLVIADARNYLLASKEKYDVIISEPSNLWVTGESGLFTREFYLIVREHLNDGGVFSQWIPFYDFSEEDTKVFFRTIKEVFPHATLWVSGNDGIIIASKEPVAMDYFYIVKMIHRNQRIKKDITLMTGGFGDVSEEYGEVYPEKVLPDTIINTFTLSDENMKSYAGKAALNSDDYPLLEFNTARNFFYLKQKSSSVANIEEYLKSTDDRDSTPPVLNIERREGNWIFLEFLGVKVNTGNWSGVFSGYSPALTPEKGRYYKTARFTDSRSSFNITAQTSKIKVFREDSADVVYVKNVYKKAEAKEMLLAKYPSSGITGLKKNGHDAYMVKYMNGERIKAMIGWYCDVNDLIYLVDVDANDEYSLTRINDDVLCVH